MANQASAASSSSSPSASVSTSYPRYDVFINHRGPDVKNTFAAHLYRRLLDHGLRVFLDKPELLQGHRITPQIKAAIQVASVHVAIFSPSYAQSKWCLEELVLMLKSKATILPVFYKVKPYQLRCTVENEEYAKALRELEEKTTVDSKTGEEKPRHNSETIQKWRSALSQAADISGFNLDSDEEELLNKVLQGVLKSVSKLPLYVAKYPTGVEDKLQDFEREVLQRHEQQVEAKVVGIVGFGGVGKTTLAKAFFNRNRSDYKESCFLFDVREQSINYLQTKLIEDLKHTTIKIQSPDEGIELLKKHLSSCEALIILDNVDKADQLEKLLPMKDILSSQSLVLVTTRDKHLLKQWRVLESSIYNMTGLNMPHSKELFCSYAFFKRFPPPEFAELVDQFVTTCGGLPLSLKVIGALLCGENDEHYWKEQFDRLQQSLPEEIQKTLRISYDSLLKEDQEVFLDIACFFLGGDRDRAIRIWGLVGIRNLENKCLLEVDSESKIRMHDHIRDCAKIIAEEGSMPRRLNNIDDLFEQSPSVITEVRGIATVSCSRNFDPALVDYVPKMPQKENNCHVHIIRNLQLVATRGGYLEGILRRVRSPHLIWLRWIGCSEFSLPDWIPMENLRVLEVEGPKLNFLWPHQSQGPLQLRELNIGAPLSEFPKSIGQLKYLESISINAIRYFSYCNSPIQIQVETLPQEFCQLCSLKYLVLQGFSRLMSLPFSFGKLTNLQYINLDSASRLQMLPNSFGDLSRLKHLSLEECSSLTISNGTLGNITTLEYLNLRGCHNVKELRSGIGDLCNLEVLQIGGQSLEVLHPSVGHLKSLKDFSVFDSPKLKCLPDSFELLTQLTEVTLEECGIEFLPEGLLKLNNLKSLTVEQCPLRELPFKTLLLNLRGCRNVKELPPQVAHQRSLKQLYLLHTNLKELPSGIGELCNLEVLHIGGKSLEVLHPSVGHLKSLKYFSGFDSPKLKCLPDSFELLTQLTEVRLEECGIEFLPEGLLKLNNLNSLRVHACPLRELPLDSANDKRMFGLTTLYLFRCTNISEVAFPEGVCPNLQRLHLTDCQELRKIRGLCGSSKLQMLEVTGCPELVGLPGVEHCMSLRYLVAIECPKLQWDGGVLQQLRRRLWENLMIDVKQYKRRKLCVLELSN